MLTSLARRLRRPRLAIALGVLLGATLAIVNLADLPGTVPWLRRTTGQTYLDFCAFCSPSQTNAALAGLGEAGRAAQRRLMLGLDLWIPSLSLAFGATALASLGGRRLLWLPLAAFALDLAENVAILRLLATWPTPSAPAASALGMLSGAKLLAYAAAVLAIAALGLARARRAA
jgi:hypothetical protein